MIMTTGLNNPQGHWSIMAYWATFEHDTLNYRVELNTQLVKVGFIEGLDRQRSISQIEAAITAQLERVVQDHDGTTDRTE